MKVDWYKSIPIKNHWLSSRLVGLSKAKRSELLLHLFCLLLIVSWALLQIWNNRFFEHYNDGVSYLDMASCYLKGNWLDGLPSSWNPLYPAIIALVFKIVHPDALHEFVVLKLVNFIIFLVTLVSFEYFLPTFIWFYNNQLKNQIDVCKLSNICWLLLAYGAFAYSFLCLNSIATDTPDMLSAAFMIVALTSVLKILGDKYTTKDYLIFGLFSGIAYIAKPAALPGILICLPFIWWKSSRRKSMKLFYAASAIILLVISPYVLYLSIQVGEPTISPSAKYNYIWFVDQKMCDAHSPTEEIKRKSLLHPMPIICSYPLVYEFAQPVKGTYPPWYDPFYWYAGYKTHFYPFWILFTALCDLWYEGLIYIFPCSLIIIAVTKSYRETIVSRLSVRANAPLLAVSISGFLQYLPVINVAIMFPLFINRYFALPALLFTLAAIASLRIRNSQRGIVSFKLAIAMTGLCLSIPLCQHFVSDLKEASQKQVFEHFLLATELNKSGLGEEDYVAQIGTEEPLVDWARLAKIKIVADVPRIKEFWSVSAAKRQDIFAQLRTKGVKMAIYFGAPISKQSKAINTYQDRNILERIFIWQKGPDLSEHKMIEPPPNEGWLRLKNLPCWIHRI